MIGKGPERKGAVWVARRVPDGHVSRPREPRPHPPVPAQRSEEHALREGRHLVRPREGLVHAARTRTSASPTPTRRSTSGALRACEARVWSVFRRVAPSLDLSVDHVIGGPSAPRLPLWVKPDAKLAVPRRDGSSCATTSRARRSTSRRASAPGRSRCRTAGGPMTWKVDGQEYLHERAISTQQTGFSFVAPVARLAARARSAACSGSASTTPTRTVYVPQYCGNRAVPRRRSRWAPATSRSSAGTRRSGCSTSSRTGRTRATAT